MGKLLYITNVSLDGYIEDATGEFRWTQPSDEVFTFITDLVRPIRLNLYGRRLYESMAVWETEPAFAAESELMGEFARVWQAPDKIVHSTTLTDVPTAKTQLRRTFDAAEVRAWKESAGTDLAIGGANLAAQAFAAGLVDECHLFVAPLFVGAGKAALPTDQRAALELLDERSFDTGVVYLRYRVV